MAGRAPRAGQLIGMGSSIVGFVVLGLVLGWWADNALDTTPVFILIGLALGVLGAIVSSVMQFRTYMKD